MAGEYFLGIDIGSISANTVILNFKKERNENTIELEKFIKLFQ